ncbi:RNA-directed DNA polymerase [Micromonospora tulbaghiae]|uniref:RNA-directed DNA polymerase n=1 Tax=Micromonospora tulbaghiae TaxID=479978 RepID=UPI0034032C46
MEWMVQLKPLEQGLVDRLKFGQAVTEEIATRRNLLPPEPWLDAVRNNATLVAEWVKSRLLSGSPNAPGVVINARKFGHGIRPVPIIGIAERIAYRALAKAATKGIEFPLRSPEEYREFVHAPITYAFEHVKGRRVRLGEARIKYVVEADITAFYQYVDHELLKQELQMQTGEIDAANKLVELLGEINDKSFGIPQLLDPSDWLSEAYIRIVERNLVRKGLMVWRFNDDFRIGCMDYRQALWSLEQLAHAAREVGLVVGDHKTFTTLFFTYMFNYTDMGVDRLAAEFDPQDVEVAVTDYSDMDEADNVAWALLTLQRTEQHPDHVGRIDLRGLQAREMRYLRRALGALTRNKDPRGIRFLTELFRYVPALTPNILGYLVEVQDADREGTLARWRELERYSVSDWQALWLTYAARKMGILQDNGHVRDWVTSNARGNTSEALRAESYLALASASLTTFEDLDVGLRVAPDALAPWYVIGMKSLVGGPNAPTDKQLGAIRQSSPLFRALLK